jgi:hypothetical protein
MAARAETLPFESTLVRRLIAPAIPWALFATSFALLKQRLLEPRLPRMSAEWLQQFDQRTRQTLE